MLFFKYLGYLIIITVKYSFDLKGLDKMKEYSQSKIKTCITNIGDLLKSEMSRNNDTKKYLDDLKVIMNNEQIDNFY